MMTVGFWEKQNPTESPSSLQVTFSFRHEASSYLTDNSEVVKKQKNEAALEKILTANQGLHQC